MKRNFLFLFVALAMTSCATPVPTPTSAVSQFPRVSSPFQPEVGAVQSGTPGQVPEFEYIALITLENKGFDKVIANPDMPVFNSLAQKYTLLTSFYAIRHPSLPNYIALISGDTFGISSDCTDCFINASSLPDLIEASGRTWKTYQESMPKPCYLGNNLLSRFFKDRYVQKHNPFVYFDSIRLDKERCERSVVPLQELSADIQAGQLPNYIFISPDMCHNSHDCSTAVSDTWLGNMMDELVPALEATGKPYLVVLTFDEGKGNQGCCGLSDGGGQIPVVLVSPSVKNGFQDATPYTHYSLLKTISASWNLAYLGHAADESQGLITAPWK